MLDKKPNRMFSLKVNKQLLDANFEGYKLALEESVRKVIELPEKVKITLPSNDQYSYQHVMHFAGFNSLFWDYYVDELAGEHHRLYYLTEDSNLQLIRYDPKSGTFDPAETVFNFSTNISSNTDSCYNGSLLFLNDHLIILTDGAGRLVVLDTGDRNHSTTWKVLYEERLLEDAANFYMSDAVIRDSTNGHFCISVLVCDIVPRSTIGTGLIDSKSTKSHFLTNIYWIDITVDPITCTGTIDRSRLLQTCGSVGYLALSTESSDILCVMSTERINLLSDSLKPVQSVEKQDIIQDIKEYTWGQTAVELCAVFTVGADVTKNNVVFALSADHVSLALDSGRVLLDGDLYGVADVDSCTWLITDGRIELTIAKRDEGAMWPEVIKGDANRGEFVADPELVQEVHERLAALTADCETNAESKKPAYNSQELEECDNATSDVRFLVWYNGDSHGIVKEADLSGYDPLFVARKKNEMPAFCLRRDVDAIVWSSNPDPDKVLNCWQHEATFLALGYVQASKQQRKYTLCSHDYSYAVVVECARHAYVYWQPSSLNSELKNRKTGQKIANMAKQQVVTVPSQNNVVGVVATPTVLYLLLLDSLIAVTLKQ